MIDKYHTSAKTIERDIAAIETLLGDYLNLEVKRERFVNDDGERDVRYLVDASQGPFLTQREVFIIAKILLASRSFDKEVVEHLINKLTRPLNQLQLAEHGADELTPC